MKKVLRVQMSDGNVYEIPALVIAEHRADFFEDNSARKLAYHSSSVQPRLRSAEIEFALKNDDVLLEWASDRMKWKDLEEHAVKVYPDTESYEKQWAEAPKQIINK
ncbi:MAG TPA: hypothetical protein VIL89_09435 [Clostridia bacterium]